MKTLRGVIFDLDGTLGDTVNVSVEAFRRTFLNFEDKEFSRTEIIAMWGPSEEGVFFNRAPEKWQDYLEFFLETYSQIHDEMAVSAFKGIIEILALLKGSGIPIAVVTAKCRLSSEISLKYFGLFELFDFIKTGSVKGMNKANQIRAIVSTWGVNPSDVIYVGDFPSDIIASREAEVIPVSAAWASTADEELLAKNSPDYLFRTTNEFYDWLEEMLNLGDQNNS